MLIYDTLIVGSGPSGIFSAIKLKELGYNVALFEYSTPGGKVNIAPRIDNFPGYDKISGPDLAFAFFTQMNEAGIELIPTRVDSVRKNGDIFDVITSDGIYHAKTVIAASGTDEKKLELDNEASLLGHGLSYCAICDGHFFKDQIVMVVAEDKYAISEAIYLAKLAKEVIVVTSSDTLKGDKRLLDELASFNNVRYIYNSKVTKLIGITLRKVELNHIDEIEVNGIFPLLGYLPNTSYLPVSILNSDGFVMVNRNYETSIKGLYAIGDVIDRELKQIYLAKIDAEKVVDVIKGYLND